MAEQDVFSFSVKADVEVEKSSMDSACRTLDNFYNKYNNKKLKIDTRDMVKAAQDGVGKIQKLYTQGMNEAAKDGGISWWQIEDGLESQFSGARSKMKEFFNEAKLIFSDGSMFSALDDNLTDVLSEKISNGITVVAADLGERVQYLKQQIADAVNGFENIGAIESYYWNGRVSGFSGDNMTESQLEKRIELLNELVESQKELELFEGKKFTQDSSPTGMTTASLNDSVNELKSTLKKLSDYNSQVEEQYKLTTKQWERRENLIGQIEGHNVWDSDTFKNAKDNIFDDDEYRQNISSLEYYIDTYKALIEQFKANEDELFRTDDGIEKYIGQIQEIINEYQGYIKELDNIKNGDNETPFVGGDFSGIIEQLKEIKEVIESINNAFKPLTDAFSNGESAIHQIITASIVDLENLENKFNEIYQMVDTISKKQFNTTNVFSGGNSAQNDIDQIREFRKEARVVFKEVQELYEESFTTADKIKSTPEGFSEFLNFTNTMGDFDLSDLAKRIKSRSATSLGVVIDELNEWKKVLLQFNSLRNNVEQGSFNVSKYTDTSSKVNIGTKAADEDEKSITAENTVDSTDILSKVKSISEQIETELTSVRAKMEETLNFGTLNLNAENVTSAIDKIYQQFVELQSKINALELNLNIPAIISQIGNEDVKKSVKQSIDDGGTLRSAVEINAEADAMQNVTDEAVDAAAAKKKFADANKEVADSAEKTSEKVKEETKKMEEAAGAIVEASDKFDKVKYIKDADGELISKTTTATTTRENAIETESKYYTYDGDEEILEAISIVKDFKKRAAELKKESDKIALAQKTVDKFISQFESKTAGQASAIKGFSGKDGLKGFQIQNLDDIEKATQKMIDLDNEYNKITKNFRQGTKSMNPFVNAITGIDEMENKILEAEIAFNNLNDKPDGLSAEIASLLPLLTKMKSYISEDVDGNKTITDIYGMSEAYGQLNSALRQVNSNIKVQRKFEQWGAKDINFGLDLEKQLANMVKQQAQWEKNGQLTDELRGKIDTMFDSLLEVTNSSELGAWKKQWSIVKDEVMATKYEIEAANKAQAELDAKEIADKKTKDAALKENVVEQYDAIMTIISNKNNALKKLMSAKGSSEQDYWSKEYSAWFGAWNALDQDVVGAFFADVGNQAILGADKVNKFNTAMEESKVLAARQTDAKTKQDNDNLENAIKLQNQLYDLKKKLANVDSGSVKGLELTRQINDKQDEYNTVVKLISAESDLISLKEKEIQLEKELAAAQKQAQNSYGKSILNQELKYYNKINAKESTALNLGLELSPEFTAKLNEYKAAFKELSDLREKFASDPSAAGDSTLEKQFSDAALKVEELRTEVMSTFKEIQKFKQLSNGGDLIGSQNFDASDLENAKAAMIEFGSAVTNGQLKFEGFNDACTEMYGTLDNGAGSVQKVTVAMLEGTNTLYAYQAGTKQVSNSWQQLGSDLTNGVKHIVSMYFGFHEALQAVRQGVTYVKEIDLALTELKKVTDETDETYKKFLSTASEVSAVIGSTVSDFTDATAAFARLGYSIDESSKMAETAIVYKNVADGLDTVEESTDSIISTMMAYGIEADNTMGIIDRFNAVGNNFAITSAGIGEAMQRSASALYAGGNTIDESIALITAANSVIQDPMQVGTALKTLTLRLRGAKVELEEAGLDAEDMVETTSQLQEKLLALTHGKVDIMIDDDTFKNTTQILREMSYAWQDMTDIERASALELMGGKRQANILSSLITNFNTVENVIETSMNSSGSALAENEKWLDSIEGKTYQFTNALETMWSNLLNTEAIKGFIDFGTEMIQFLDTVPGKITAIIAALAGIAKFKGYNVLTLGSDALKSFNKMGTSQSVLDSLKKNYSLDGLSTEQSAQYIQLYGSAVSSLIPKLQANMLATSGLTKAQIQYAMQCNGVKQELIDEATAHVAVKNASNLARDAKAQETIANTNLSNSSKVAAQSVYAQARATNTLGASFKALLASNPALVFTAIGTALVAFAGWVKDAIDSTEELKESYSSLQESISSTENEISSIDSELNTLQEKIDELSNKKLTLTEAEELQKLKEQSAELERQKEIQQKILDARNKQNQVKSLAMINNMLGTTAANQEKNAESAAKWGKTIGWIAGAGLGALAVALAPFTGGGSLLAAGTTLAGSLAGAGTTVLTAGTLFGSAGSSIGESLFKQNSLNNNELNSLTEWYDSYTEAINKAEQEADEAEKKYINDVSDNNYDNWQKKVEAVSALQTEMYDRLQEMQGYIDNLEYNDQTASVIDEYNNLMTHISVKSMDGDINAQIQSLEALKSEYAELSKGVDENGNNITLSAQEYARYQTIVTQLLGYNTGLTQTFDENGSAIKDANGNLVSYNSALETTISLLKQQQQLAAKDVVGLGDNGNSTFLDSFNNIINSGKPENIEAEFLPGMAQKAIQKVTGNKPGFWDSFEDFTIKNLDDIRNNIGKIETELINSLTSQGHSQESIDNYVSSFRTWFDNVVSQVTVLSDKAKTELKNLLYIIPQASDSYYNGDLSGNSLNFINDYIDSYVEGIENIEDLTDEQKTAIRDNILALTNAIGNDTDLQEAIDKVFTLDSSSMSISEYKEQVQSGLSEIFSSDTIKGVFSEEEIAKTKSNLLESLIPNQEQIDKMLNTVKGKFKGSLQGLEDALTQDELKIVYRVILDKADGSMSIDDFKNVLTESFAGLSGPIVQTSSTMQAEIDSFNDVITQTGEILIDNTEVTQEYKDALIALGVSESELGEYFYDDNKLVVKNADGLKKLVKQTTSLSKAQAQLKYYNLVKQLSSSLTGVKNLTSAEITETNALVAQISKLQQTIYQYQLLEDTLLGTSNAFKKFAEAQEIDAQNTYGDDYVSMAQSIYDAYYLTGQVGTETVDAAVEALIAPFLDPSLEKHSDAYHQAVFDAFNNRVLPTLTIDEDTISLEVENIQSFVEDNLGGIFEGTSFQEFDLAEGMNLDTVIEKTGKTKTELYALFATLKKYTGQDYLLQLDDSNAGQITKITSEMQKLNEEKLALLSEENGYEKHKTRIAEINSELQECQSKLGVVADKVRETWDAYSDADTALEELNQIEDKTEKLTEGQAKDLNIDWKEVEGKTIQETIDYLIARKQELGEPTPVELQVALDDVEADLAKAQNALDTLNKGGTIDVDLNGDGAIDDANALKTKIKELEAEKASITLKLQTEDGADIGDKVDEIIRQLSIISGSEPKVKVGADTTDADKQIDEFIEKELPDKEVAVKSTSTQEEPAWKPSTWKLLDPQNIAKNTDILFNANLNSDQVKEEIEEVTESNPEVNLSADTKGVLDPIAGASAQLKSFDGQQAVVTATAETESAKQELNEVGQTADNLSAEPVTVTVLAEADTETLLGKLKEFQSTYETLKTTIEIGADETEAKANFQAAVAALNQESPEVLAKLGIDMTQSSAQINTVISSLTPEIMVNCGLNKTAVDAFVAVEHTANGTVTWNNDKTKIDEYIAEEKATTGTVIWDNDISAVDSWIAQNHEAYGTVKWYNDIDNVKTTFTATGTVEWEDSGTSSVNGTANVSGTAHVNGTAYKGGNWGAPRTEKALVGELGPEMVVRGNRWFTVGENGAEFTDIRKNDIIFNHKQTEQLLSNGHITGRGKAYVSGTAYSPGGWLPVGGSSGSSSSDDYSDSSSSSSSDYSDSYDDATDSAEEFEETLDWIEILLEEINEQLDLMSAKVENVVSATQKNNIIDNIIDVNKTKMTKLQAGIKKYADYAAKLLAEVPASYRKAAQDGAIAIEEFTGEADEKTVEAIRNYREWAQKVADLKQQLEEVKTEIADLAKQEFDNISDYFDNRTGIFDKNIEQYEGLNDTAETMGLPGVADFYKQMMAYSQKRQNTLVAEMLELQTMLDWQVEKGNIQVGDDRWYEMVEAIYDVDIAIQECVVDMEDYQNAINDIYWDNFDELISRLEGISDETQNLIDLMDSADMVITPETENGWSADQVEWTKEGIASLGLYAQQMETAEYTAKQYEKAIDDLNKDYKKGLYSESEYIEKLNELKSAQYDSIEAYYDAQDAIVELNKTRVDSIKKGIEKEIEAYEKLIKKKKEELDAEKDLYDFQKNVGEQSKNIAEIERKLAALASDNSVSAAAKRKKLEAELAEAQYELQDAYYNRSVEDKQNALDKELENFQEEKDAEVEKWEEYLEQIETVVADSLLLVQNNATGVYDTLNEKANEYGLTLSDTVLAPWKDGTLAIDEYQEKFGKSMSSTMEQLAALKKAWQDVISEITKEAKITVTNVKESNANITAAKKETPKKATTSSSSNNKNTSSSSAKKPSLTTGTYVEVKSGTKWYADSYGGGSWGYARSGKIKYINTSGSHAYNIEGLGWVRKQDIVGYASGTKSLKKSGIVNIDELGEELVIGAHNGRLTYLEKGSGVIPADITSNLMSWGKLNPQEILDRNRPSVAPHKNVFNSTEINLDASVGTLVNIEHFDGNNPDEIVKIVNKAYDKKMQELNNSIKRFSR